jgi:hypothetical protein
MATRKGENNSTVPSTQASDLQSQPLDTPDPSSSNGSRNGAHPIDNASLAELVEPGKDHPATVETEGLQPPADHVTDTPPIPRKKLFIDSDDDLFDEEAVLTSCSVRRPSSHSVFRVRPGKQWRAEALIVDFREQVPEIARGKYLIVGNLQAKFKEFGRKVLLITCVSSTGQVFLWDINIVSGFGDSWYKSDLNIIRRAERDWMRYLGSVGNAHDARKSKKDHGEPRWPGAEVQDIYDLALVAFSEERLVEDLTHPLCDHFEIE